MNISLQKHFFAVGLAILLVFIVWIARTVLIPITFSLLFAFVLFPGVKWLKEKGLGLIWSIIITMLGFTMIVLGTIIFFSAQLVSLIREFENFQSKLTGILDRLITLINDEIPFVSGLSYEIIVERVTEFFSSSGVIIVSDTLNTTSTFLSYLILTILYSFLILLLYKNLTRAVISSVREENQDDFLKMLKDVRSVGQKYLTGMGLLILILGILNTIGLLIIGIDYAFFFGFLAAILAIIPYIGTTLGGLIPTLYALMEYDSFWYPVAVVLTFWFIQTLEGNVLSPKIVGGKLNLNALAAIIALIVGGTLWGLPGVILAMPIAAMMKVVFENFEELKPIALLMDGGDKQEKESKLLSRIRKKIPFIE